MASPTVGANGLAPTVDDITGGAASGGSTAATSHDVELPATVNAGDLLMIFGRVAVAGTVAVTGGGWTITQDATDASDDVTFWAYRNTLAAGSEDGTVVTVTHGSGRMVAQTMAIGGAADPATQAPQASTVAVGTSTTPNPTTCTPTGGAKDYLWIWFGGWEGEQTLSKTQPTSYTDQPDISTGTGGVVATNCQIKTARRALNAASEDAGSVTISTSDDWTAWLIAVHPAGPPPPNSGSVAGGVEAAGLATGSAPYGGSVTGTLDMAGSATGSAPAGGPNSGASTGTVTLAGSAVGGRASAGVTSGAVTTTGTAAGSAPMGGSVTGTLATAGSATGSHVSAGATTGTLTISGSATGAAPVAGVNEGAATGTLTLAGSVTGQRSPVGSATGAVAAAGSATGERTSSGAATGTVTATGAADGFSGELPIPSGHPRFVPAGSHKVTLPTGANVVEVS